MDTNSSKKDSFILQAGFLAAAGIISRVIGLLYRSPLHSIIGDLGMSYYQSAYYYYTIILLVSSYSIPSAMSKVIAQKLALKEYKNAHKMFRCAMWYVLVIGLVASFLLYFGAGLFVADQAIPVLKCFAPTIFVYGMLGVLRGYFQAHKSMSQTSASQIFEQIANAIVSVGAAYMLIMGMCGTMAIPTEESALIRRSTLGAMGSALGTGSGVVVALIFMYGMYCKHRKSFFQRMEEDTTVTTQSYPQLLKEITQIVTPFILSTAVYNLSGVMNDQAFNKWIPALRGFAVTVERSKEWGVYTGTVLTISNIPIAFASAMAAAMIPAVAHQIAIKDIEGAKEKIHLATKTTMILSIPSAVGIFVFASPIIALLFPPETEASALLGMRLLMAMAPSVVFYALSTLNSSILQGIGKVNTPIVNAAISILIQTILAIVLCGYTPLGLYGIAIAATTYSFMMCLLNQYAVRKAIGYRQEFRTSFAAPFMASVFMGAVGYGIYLLLRGITRSPRISVLIAIGISAVVYFIFLLLCRGVSEDELRSFPKGWLLVKIAKKCRFM